MKRAWLINRCVTDNIGDILIGESHKRILYDRRYHVTHLEIKGERSGQRDCFFLKLIWRLVSPEAFYFLRVLSFAPRAIKERPDVISIGGGQLLLPRRSFSPPLLAWFIIAKLVGAKLIFFSVGTERPDKIPKGYTSFIKIIKFVCNRAESISVRDQESKKYLTQVGCNKKIEIIPDCVYYTSLLLCSRINEKKSDIVISLAHKGVVEDYSIFPSFKRYMDFVAEVLASELHEGERISLIPTTKEDFIRQDLIALELKNRINRNIVLPENFPTAEEYVRLIKSTRLVVSSRMHALIIADVSGVEAKPIPINIKLASFAASKTGTELRSRQGQISAFADSVYGDQAI